MKTFSVIITAGGIGKRMNQTLPKQFIEVAGKPVLMHTLERFHQFDPDAELVITLPLEWKEYWEGLIKEHNCTIPHTIIDGGEERYHSVKNAIRHCSGDYIAVHDGVRPLVSNDTLRNCWDVVVATGAVVPVVPVKESLRKIGEHGSVAMVRSEYRLVQTPQCFSKEVILDAYSREYHAAITDDASLVEEAGYHVALVHGNDENIKLTTPSDLLFAQVLLKDSIWL
jgi:2-C-methyl-D-erythritol 4-phosphate cytidylyltransferase